MCLSKALLSRHDANYTFIDQPEEWIGPVVRPCMPKPTNLRQDPFERMNWPNKDSIARWGASFNIGGLREKEEQANAAAKGASR